VNRADLPLPPLTLRNSTYSELNLTVKRVLAHWELHGGLPGRLARHLVEWPARWAVRGASLAVNSPDALEFDPTQVDLGIGPITRRLIRWFNYDSLARRRRENYQWLVRALAGSDVWVLREDLPDGAVPLFFPIAVADKFQAVERLNALGIEAVPVWGVHHPHLPRGAFPDVEWLVDHAVELPVYQDLAPRHLRRIRDAMVHAASWPRRDREHYPAETLGAVETATAEPVALLG
jgi:hypothetical protein